MRLGKVWRYFQPSHLKILSQAVALSEEIISDSFRLTSSYWVRNPYVVKTLKGERPDRFPKGVYAHLEKYGNNWQDKSCGKDSRNLYRITILDPRVLEVTRGNHGLIMPFLLYIMTHELIHIVRFGRFEFAANVAEKSAEEEEVHNLTEKVLKDVQIPRLDEVIEFFNGKGINLCMN